MSRNDAKTHLYGLMYGAGAAKLGLSLVGVRTGKGSAIRINL